MMDQEGLMEELGLGELLELGRRDGLEEEMGGYLLCQPSSSSTVSQSQMLCFSGVALAQKSSDSSSLTTLSSSPPSTTTSNDNSPGKSSKLVEDRNGGGYRRAAGGAAAAANASKKPKTGASSTIKVRKEKLGERITALQQLVSPFGKSDTASVLHEALGYIRFLHDQVQVLSSPYLQRLPHLHDGGEAEQRGDLRSRGLCLVPISSTEHVADSNGADLWSSSPMGSSSNDYYHSSSSNH